MAEFKHKDIIALRDLNKQEIELLLSTAESMREINSRDIKKVPTLRGKTIINLFYEASTRSEVHRAARQGIGDEIKGRIRPVATDHFDENARFSCGMD